MSGASGIASGDRMLPALLDGLDTALFAVDGTGRVTHWNRHAERLLGWPGAEAVGRASLGGWAVREADEPHVRDRLLTVPPGTRRTDEFALLRRDGGRVLVRATTTPLLDGEGHPAGAYCAFGEAGARFGRERDAALAAALLGDSPWAVVVLDADLRVLSVNARAARVLELPPEDLLGDPLAESFAGGIEELESAVEHTLAGHPPGGPVDLWLAPQDAGAREGAFADPVHAGAGLGGSPRRCLLSGFLRLAAPGGDPAPLGVAWLFEDVTRARLGAQAAARRRFRDSQLTRAARAAAECRDPMEAAVLHLHFALPGFADHALLDVAAGGDAFVRLAETPGEFGAPASATRGVPVGYRAGHPVLQAWDRGLAVRVTGGGVRSGWAADHRWPQGVEHALCVPMRSLGRQVGVLTFLRGGAGRPFDRADTVYGEDVALRAAAAVDLELRGRAG